MDLTGPSSDSLVLSLAQDVPAAVCYLLSHHPQAGIGARCLLHPLTERSQTHGQTIKVLLRLLTENFGSLSYVSAPRRKRSSSASFRCSATSAHCVWSRLGFRPGVEAPRASLVSYLCTRPGMATAAAAWQEAVPETPWTLQSLYDCNIRVEVLGYMTVTIPSYTPTPCRPLIPDKPIWFYKSSPLHSTQ